MHPAARCFPVALHALSVLALAACAPALEFARPDPEIPAQWPSGSAAPGTAVEAAQVHWRAFFRDPRLHALIEHALAFNRDLRVAAGRVQEARALWDLARAEQWPLLNLFGRARLDRTYAENLSLEPERRIDLNLSAAAFEVDFFGRLASLSEAARANYLATEEARRTVELSLVAQVADLYLAQRHAEELLVRSREMVKSRARTLEILGRARDIGVVHDLELEQARFQLEAARAQRAQLGLVRQQTDNLMQLLVGPTPRAMPEALPFEQLLATHDLTLGVPAEVLLLRPDVAAAEQRLAAAHANIKAARAAFFPRVLLTGNVGTASAGLLGLFRMGAWAFQPTISIPLFDAGRNQAGWDLAKARELIVVAQYERTVQQAFREVADQLAARASLALQAGTAERSSQAQRLRLQIQRQRHEAGLGGFLEVLEAERELLAAEQAQAGIRRAQLEALVGLYRALGGGSVPPSASHAGRPPAGDGGHRGS